MDLGLTRERQTGCTLEGLGVTEGPGHGGVGCRAGGIHSDPQSPRTGVRWVMYLSRRGHPSWACWLEVNGAQERGVREAGSTVGWSPGGSGAEVNTGVVQSPGWGEEGGAVLRAARGFLPEDRSPHSFLEGPHPRWLHVVPRGRAAV